MERILKTLCILTAAFFVATAVGSVSEPYVYAGGSIKELQRPVVIRLSFEDGRPHGIYWARLKTDRAVVNFGSLFSITGEAKGTGTIPANDTTCDKSWTFEADMRASLRSSGGRPIPPYVIDVKGVKMTFKWNTGGPLYSFDTVINGKTYNCSMYWMQSSNCYQAAQGGKIVFGVGLRAYEK